MGLRQCGLRVVEPERHAHRTEEYDGGRRFGAGFLRSAVPGIQRAKSKVTVGQERCHLQFQGRNTPR